MSPRPSWRSSLQPSRKQKPARTAGGPNGNEAKIGEICTRSRGAASSLLTRLGPTGRLVADFQGPPSDKGTPGKSRGRKATGPRLLRDAAVSDATKDPQDRRAADRGGSAFGVRK